MNLLETLQSISSESYLQALLIFLVTYVSLYLFRTYILRHLDGLANKTVTDLDDALIAIIKSIHWPFYIIVPLYAASLSLTLPTLFHQILTAIFLITVSVYGIRFIQKIILFALRKSTNEKDQAIVQLLGSIIKVVLWILLGLMVMSNLGFNVNSLLAGVGIGGIAIALAVQNVLSDLFSAFSIYFDKPFEVGDTIQVGSDFGTVEKIGIKSTRLKTLQGEEMIISNQELTSARIQNFKRLQARNIYYKFGVTYDTAPEKLKKIPDMVKEVLTPIELINVARVHFKSLGDSALIYEVLFTVNSDQFDDYMDAQQEINLALVEKFGKEGIEFAFPSQTVYLHKED